MGKRREASPEQYSRAEAEELYKTGARGGVQQEVRQRVQQEDGAEEEQKEEERRRRRSRRIKSENHSQRFGKKVILELDFGAVSDFLGSQNPTIPRDCYRRVPADHLP